MYTQSQKALSFLLLTSFLLQSCGTNLALGGKKEAQTSVREEVKHPLLNAEQRPEAPAATPAELQEAPRSYKPAFTYFKDSAPSLQTTQHRRNPPPTVPSRPRRSTIAPSSPHNSASMSRQQASPSTPARAEAKAITTVTSPTAPPPNRPANPSHSPVKEATAITQTTFTLADGQQVQFQPGEGNTWQAHVTDRRFTGCSSTTTYPVLCEQGQDLETLLNQLAIQTPEKQRQRLGLIKCRPPFAPQVLYLGERGLKGGMMRADDPRAGYAQAAPVRSEDGTDSPGGAPTEEGQQEGMKEAEAEDELAFDDIASILENATSKAALEVLVNVHKEQIKVIKKTDEKSNEEDYTLLHFFSENNDDEVVDAILKCAPELAASHTSAGTTCLHLAARYADCDMASVLVNAHPSLIAQKDKKGANALHYAARNEEYEDVITFLGRKRIAMLLEQDNNGFVPLHVALVFRQSELASQIYELNRDAADIPNKYGVTPRKLAEAIGITLE